MKPKDKALQALFDSIARPDNRSPLFWWLLDHHDRILDAAAGRRLRWATLCAHFAELGLTDTKGKPPTERNARETWAQVRKEAKRLRARPAAPDKPKPARLPPGWQPTPSRHWHQPAPVSRHRHRRTPTRNPCRISSRTPWKT